MSLLMVGQCLFRIAWLLVAAGTYRAAKYAAFTWLSELPIINESVRDVFHLWTASTYRRVKANDKLRKRLEVTAAFIQHFYITMAVVGWISCYEPFNNVIITLYVTLLLRRIVYCFLQLPTPTEALFISHGKYTSYLYWFSGHTTVALGGTLMLTTLFGSIGSIIGLLNLGYTMWFLMVFRAHYSIDVFGALVTFGTVYSVVVSASQYD